MVKALILYFLSIKPTHGYEIQKYIQINHMESWTKIQSGSIYYALSKLESEGLIVLYKVEKIGKKSRKIYRITEQGQSELSCLLRDELDKMIYEVGSNKFILYPFLGVMDRDILVQHIEEHLKLLNQKKSDTKKWQSLKVTQKTLAIEQVCFEMMVSNIDYQIKWHEALLRELDPCISLETQMARVIKKVDFSNISEEEVAHQLSSQEDIESLKEEILSNPETAAEKLEHLIQVLRHK